MFRYLSCMGGITSRCRFTILLLMGVMILTFSTTVSAGLDPEHGASISKNCGPPVRACEADVDCQESPDNLCTLNTCPTQTPEGVAIPTLLRCTFTIGYNDDFMDTLEVIDAFDIITTALGPFETNFGNGLTINGTAGNAVCASGGTALPCTLSPAGGGQESGEAEFS